MSDEPLASENPTADDDLVVRARTDRAAFGILYDRYYAHVARYCLRRLFDRTIAEDVVSDVFLQVASHLREFPGRTGADFRRWLFRIATNAVTAHLRHSRRRQELWEAAARGRHWDRGSGSGSSQAEHERHDWPVVYQALLELEERDQTIVTLRYFARLRELLAGRGDAKNDQYERLGEKEIDGKKAMGFRYDSPADTVTLWGDPATGMPVRIESVWGGLPRTETTMSHFEINVELQESLFDTTPPEGYKVQSLDVDASAFREEDLVKAFRACSDISGGDFPETLDTAGVTRLIIKYTSDQIKDKKDVSDEQMHELMKQSIAIGRGFQFALMLPETADAHYAGKGVKRDTKDRPIFWYRSEETRKYRVILADFSVRDAESAPQVEGARRIEKASKTSKPDGK